MNDLETSSWGSYPKIYAIGHRALRDLFNEDVLVEEKIDGSQFSFGVYDTEDGPELKIKSKGAMIYPEAPEKMFKKAVEYVVSIQDRLQRNWKYSGEYLNKPKHNTLVYKRTPLNNIMIFDICTGQEEYLPHVMKKTAAASIGLEVVPVLHWGVICDIADFRKLLDTESILEGQKIEGFVIKNYKRFGLDGKALMGKFVSEEFKEAHSKSWSEGNPGTADAIQRIGLRYQVQARWMKAVQHLKEAGKLEQDPRDIGNLIKEVKRDVLEECEDEIRDQLWKAFKDKITRMSTGGLPEWYKNDYLLKQQFEEEEE